MQRYFLEAEAFKSLTITNDDLFHIRKVMRNQVGDQIEVVYDKTCYLAEITVLDSEACQFKLLEELSKETPNPYEITLIQGLPKGDKLDDIIMHSTELGVNHIICTEMIRSIAKINTDKLANKLKRYQKIAKEASEQAHILSIPVVSYQKSLEKIDFSAYDLCLLLDEEEAKKENGLTLNKIALKNYHKICFIVGPEGGIDPKEREFLLTKNVTLVSLGKNILRTQTASLAFLAMLKYALLA